MHYLYSESDAVNDIIVLEGEEARHALVLRLKKEEKVGILNGHGRVCIGFGEQKDKKSFHVTIQAVEEKPLNALHVHIAIAPTKQIDRFEWFLEKATELGVQTITPLICDHGERERLNMDRLKKILIASIKQSGRLWLPSLHDPIVCEEFLNKQNPGAVYLAHSDGSPLKNHDFISKSSICICIGPEGDFSEKELSLASQLDIPRISFGSYRLRTETAGLYAAAYFAQWNM